MRSLRRIAVLAVVCLVAVAGHDRTALRAQSPPRVLVFAAASLQSVLDELTPALSKSAGATVVASYAASSTLAQQIDRGAPADLFISADIEWMDDVASRHLIQPASRVNLLGNHLVLIAPAGSGATLHITERFGLKAALGGGRLALADPDSVPAGKYAKAALVSLGVWDDVRSSIAPAENVRAALALVARGEAPLGIVYATDATSEPHVRVVDRFEDRLAPPIVYPAALTVRAGPQAAAVLRALESADARRVFERDGFTVIAR